MRGAKGRPFDEATRDGSREARGGTPCHRGNNGDARFKARKAVCGAWSWSAPAPAPAPLPGLPRRKLVSILYADPHDLNGVPERRVRMFDLLYLATGLGFFALMAAYARWAGQA
ncbi:hypothetical protein [Aureimonas sp. Leaf454]|uniref:hypothetical protein n=1 Tax=Aureimonas sp. Leaf454 TaxID=1736381 RepID=UPI000A600597|nr:hypothetical protein [Aureimonas sp. Leaf454]